MYRRFGKRALDLAAAIILFALALIIALIIAPIIKLTSPGPVVFRQPRAGKNGKIFTIYKFRTMSAQTHRDGHALTDMERMTRVGSVMRKLSLDELPQLINILKGEMSFIGPRPLLVEYLPRYSAFQARRHEVRPGITGWAQVNGRNAVDWPRRFELDVWYVDNLSFATDARVLARTVSAVLGRKGINRSEGDTMTLFMGEGEGTP